MRTISGERGKNAKFLVLKIYKTIVCHIDKVKI